MQSYFICTTYLTIDVGTKPYGNQKRLGCPVSKLEETVGEKKTETAWWNHERNKRQKGTHLLLGDTTEWDYTVLKVLCIAHCSHHHHHHHYDRLPYSMKMLNHWSCLTRMQAAIDIESGWILYCWKRKNSCRWHVFFLILKSDQSRQLPLKLWPIPPAPTDSDQ